MVSGVGPTATLEDYGIPVVVDVPGVGQNEWVCDAESSGLCSFFSHTTAGSTMDGAIL